MSNPHVEIFKLLWSAPDKLAQNEVTLRQGANELKLSIPNQVVLEIKVEEEAKQNSSKRSLEIEIEWTEGEAGKKACLSAKAA